MPTAVTPPATEEHKGSEGVLAALVSQSGKGKKKKAPRYQVGNTLMTVGTKIVDMHDSTELFLKNDFVALRQRLEDEGFLLVRGAIPRDTVLKARKMMLQHLHDKGAIEPGTPLLEGKIGTDEHGKLVEGWTVDAESGGVVGDRDTEYDGWRHIGNSKTLTDVYNGPALHSFFGKLFGCGYKTQPGCTWLRMRGRGDLTVEHADYYYFKENTDLFSGSRETKRNTSSLSKNCFGCHKQQHPEGDELYHCSLCDVAFHATCVQPQVTHKPKGEWHCPSCADMKFDIFTCWTPLGEVNCDNGTLAVAPGTHKLHGYDVPSKGRQLPLQYGDVEKKAQWQTTAVHPGDIILFNIKLVHAAVRNQNKFFRLSLDTRVVGATTKPSKPDAKQLSILSFLSQSKPRATAAGGRGKRKAVDMMQSGTGMVSSMAMSMAKVKASTAMSMMGGMSMSRCSGQNSEDCADEATNCSKRRKLNE